MLTNRLGVPLAMLLAAPAAAQVTYQFDDGTGQTAGVATAGRLVWGNYFTVQGGAGEITEIQIAVGRLPDGVNTLMAALYEDPTDDGDPDDCVLLAAEVFWPAAFNSNTFTPVLITPTIVSGSFYAACVAEVDGTPSSYAMRLDPSTGAAHGANTFVYWGPNLNPLIHSGWSNRAQYTGLATAMVRAVGQVPSTQPCPADIGGPGGVGAGDGVLDNNDFVVFIDRFFGLDVRADIGATGGVPGADGQFDANDFIVFIDRFFAGC